MLILTRKIGEAIIIQDDISVRVLEIRGRQVRLGIDAPKECPVHREEIFDKLKRQGLIYKCSAEELAEQIKNYKDQDKEE